MNNKEIIQVYSGISNRCCCGCSGKHRYASKYRAWSSKHRGYSVKDEEVSDRSVKIITNKVLNSPDVQHEGNHSFVDNGRRILIVYYKE